MKLDTSLDSIFRLQAEQKKALKRLGIATVGDLLYYFPTRYGDAQTLSYIKDLKAGDTSVIYAVVTNIKARKAWKSKVNLTEATLEDPSGATIKALWFSQPYISKMLPQGSRARFSGVINKRSGSLALINPEYELLRDIPIEQSGQLFSDDEQALEQTLYPVYKETKSITSRWIYHHIQKLFGQGILDSLSDPVPQDILERYKLPRLADALVYMHAPRKPGDAEAARKRFAFEEMFFAQLVRQNERAQYEQSGAFRIESDNPLAEKFVSSLPFSLTRGQEQAIATIAKDMASDVPMSRLLEGDVGSGKTIIAAHAALLASTTRPKNQTTGYLQVAYMAPTEILAKQIFADFCELFKDYPITIGLLTSKDCRKYPSKTSSEATSISKAQLLKWTLNGEIQILVGTHALISKHVFFENLGLVIIDEQHRFGKKQRAALRMKPAQAQAENKRAQDQEKKVVKQGRADNSDILPHLLSMSATPIPRTLALTIYGDLDLTVLDELPPGRKKIQTSLVAASDREQAYAAIRAELKQGRQAYVICPRISDAEPGTKTTVSSVSAISEAKRLQEDVFPEYKVGLVHSKLNAQDKEQAMSDFVAGNYDILVATSVVEVGVNVPNATSIIIEGAERFGLAQLHQLRGRVMRSAHQPYCYLFSSSQNEQSLKRLQNLTESHSGFDLAEADLQFRGSGELVGNKQSGMSDLAMVSLHNLKLVEAARNEANAIVQEQSIKKHPALFEKFEATKKILYME